MNKTILAFYIGVKSENKKTELFDRLICLVTNSRYSHVEIVTSYNRDNGIGSCWSSSPRDGGVRWAMINLKKQHWEVFEVDSDAPAQDVLDWFSEHDKKKYDWLGAFATTLKFLPQIAGRWFCSEAVGAALKLNKPYKLTPKGLFNHYASTAVRLNP